MRELVQTLSDVMNMCKDVHPYRLVNRMGR